MIWWPTSQEASGREGPVMQALDACASSGPLDGSTGERPPGEEG